MNANVLFIGNSLTFWNMGVDAHLKGMAATANPVRTIETESVVKGGATLEKLWDDRTLDEIRNGDWDVVVLQEELEEGIPLDEDYVQTFYEYTRKFDAEIKKAGAEPILFMSWVDNVSDTVISIEDTAQAHQLIAEELGLKVAPVGLAWPRSIEERSDLELYELDGDHPTILGTYLTTCVLYAAIFDESPVGLSYLAADVFPEWEEDPDKDPLKRYRVEFEMTEEEAAFLQRIAWETVQEYQSNE